MKFNAILHQFGTAFKTTARTVMRPAFNPILVGIAVVLNVKTMNRHNGWTVNSQSYCPSSILW